MRTGMVEGFTTGEIGDGDFDAIAAKRPVQVSNAQGPRLVGARSDTSSWSR